MQEKERGNEPHIIEIPATKKTILLNKQMFATIVSMIPVGKLTTQEAIYQMWAKRKGGDYCELGGGILPLTKTVLWQPTDVQRVDFISELQEYCRAKSASDPHGVKLSHLEDCIPYWRIISERGALVDFGTYCDKETQKELLEQEGHVILQPDPNKRVYKVQNYKEALFDLDKLIINE